MKCEFASSDGIAEKRGTKVECGPHEALVSRDGLYTLALRVDEAIHAIEELEGVWNFVRKNFEKTAPSAALMTWPLGID